MANTPFQQRFGPWAIVTGASAGIGRALAEGLAQRGLHLVLVARRAAELESFGQHLKRTYGIEVRCEPLDLSIPESTSLLAERTNALDVGLLVAAAGFGSSGPFVQADLNTEREMLAVNCRVLLELSHTFARRFVTRGRGGLILPGSIVGWQGTPGSAHYAATKAYVQSLAEGLHVELKPSGVHVLALAPGPVHSGFAERAGLRMATALKPEQIVTETLNALAAGRMTVEPGALTKLLSLALSTAPRSLRVRIMQRVMSDMAAQHRAQ